MNVWPMCPTRNYSEMATGDKSYKPGLAKSHGMIFRLIHEVTSIVSLLCVLFKVMRNAAILYEAPVGSY